MSPSDPLNADRNRLRDHFSHPYSSHPQRWDDLWADGSWLPWDRQGPNPALLDALQQHRELLGTATEASSTQNSVADRGDLAAQRRKTALVPGCGRGYDVLLLASLGYDAYGLEVSDKAVEAAVVNASESWDKYRDASAADAGLGKSESGGRYTFVKGDFFGDEWMVDSAVGSGGKGAKFDLIYDYTFLCALPPDARPAWAQRMSELLSKEGRLVCLEFPLYKDPHLRGPPFGLSADAYVAHLSRPGEKLPYTEAGYPEGEAEVHLQKKNEVGLVRLERWKAERTHKIGEGTDHVSVWGHA